MSILRGRMNRASYWLALAILILVYAALNYGSSKPVPVSEAVLVMLCVPRLHDLGRSAWFILIPFFLELGAIAGFAFFPLAEAKILAGAATLLIGGFVILLGALPGEPQANRFGEVPSRGLPFRKTQIDRISKTFD
jgi:uncharacterized membrane protein YhaH (DUF805 family)